MWSNDVQVMSRENIGLKIERAFNRTFLRFKPRTTPEYPGQYRLIKYNTKEISLRNKFLIIN